MAQFKDLLVSGASRFIGKAYGSTFVGYLNGNADSAQLAYKDANGKDITEYISGLSINNNVITYTDGEGVSKTLTVQNTTYSTGTSASEGLTKLYGTTGSNTDGTMNQDAITTELSGKLSTEGTAAAAVKDNQNQTIDETYIKNASISGQDLTFTKGDGSTFKVVTQDNNTTYGSASSSSEGLTKVYSTTGNNTDGTMDQNSITAALDSKLSTSGTAAAANKDSNDQKIDETYIKGVSVSGQDVTFTKGDNSTFKITTQDNNTTYDNASSSSAGLVKLYASTGSNTDGTMTQSVITSALEALETAIGNISSFDVVVLGSEEDLPAEGAAHTIYFKPKEGSSGDVYNEYIWVNNGYEKIGSTAVDLSDYYTSSQVDSAIAGNIVDASVSGTSITFTKKDASTFSITTQDTNTTYGSATSAAEGLTKVYNSTGSNTDGTMNQNAISEELNGKLSTSGTAAAAIKDNKNQTIDETYLKNAEVSGQDVTFTKGDGSTFKITTQDNNTTYDAATSATAGLVKLYSSTGSNTDGAVSQKVVSEAIEDKLSTSGTAAAAVKDNKDQTIDETYIKDLSVSGTTVTATKGDGSTFTFNTQDTNDNTTYSTGTSETEGLTKLYGTTGTATDGTLDQNTITSELNGKLSTAGTAAAATNDSAGQKIDETYLKNASVSGQDVTFTKGDGSTFKITTQDTNDNTTYSTGTSESAGLTKLYNAVGTNTDGTMNQSAIKTALDGKLSTTGTAAAATNDSAGQKIDETYLKGVDVDGQTVTFTKGDGSTLSITTQDTNDNTTYSTGTSVTAGLTKLFDAVGPNTDGTMTQGAIKTALEDKLSTTGTAAAATKDSAGQIITETYLKNADVSGNEVTFTKGDGSTFSINTQDTDTTYSAGTSETAGLTKLYTGIGTNTDGTMTQNAIKTALDGKLSTSGTAAKATADASGNNITETYIKDADVSGQDVTFTKGDGSTFKITTQDTNDNTTYSTGDASNAGLTKLYSTTGSNTDGTMNQSAISDALATKLGVNATASYALNDSTGQKIHETYLKDADVSGKDVTFTKGDGSTFKVTTQDTNTTYTTGTSTSAGLLKVYSTTGNNTDGTMTQQAITDRLETKLGLHSTADYALNDSTGQKIHETYLKNAEVSGKDVTFTKGDGSTFKITTQDSNTTYGTGTSSTAGIVKMYASTGSNIDGTMTQNAIKTALEALDTKIGNINSFDVVVCASDSDLPATGESHTIYFVPVADSSTNKYVEYIWITAENRYEEIGFTDVDLSSYYTSTQTDTAISNATSATLTNASISGTTLTFTKKDGSTFSVTTQDNNTTYGSATSASAGLLKVYSTTGNNTDGTMTQQAITDRLDTKLGVNATASYALNDSTGQKIHETYLKDASVSGQDVTFTKGDGSTFKITTQDNNTTYGTGTSTSAGLTKLYTSTGTSTDGTMTRNAIKTELDGKLATNSASFLSNASISGKDITITKGDGSTFKITTQDNNTTYGTGDASNAGLTKLYTGTGTNTDGTMTQSAIKTALDGKLSTSGTATAATNDSAGQKISTTYLKNAEVSGKDVTFTKGDGSTFKITTQDTNTTYTTGTSTSAGLTKLYTGTGSNTDGTMTQSAIKSALDGKLSTAGAFVSTASVSGKDITFTKGDGSTFKITTQDTNTTYTTGSSTSAGLTKLYTGTGTNTDGTMTQNAIKSALDGKLSTNGTAVKATGDGSGNEIVKTYIKNASVSGQTVTFTKGDGSTFSVTTQDNNTTYTTGSSTSAGLTKLYTGTGTNTDGTMTQSAIKSALDGKLSTAGGYVSTASVSGKDITFTKADGSTFKITTQDTNTTYTTGDASNAGLTKLYTTTGTSTDGTMTRKAISDALSGKMSTAGAFVSTATVSGKDITFSKGDGSTFKITTQDTNTTYGAATSSSAGLTKLYTSTGTSTDGTMDRNSITTGLNAKLTNASVSGRDITFTKGDGSTFKITTQDNNTTYTTGSSTSAGLTKLYTGTGTNTDGTMTQNAIKSALDGKLATNSASFLSNASISGKDITITKGDGSTFKITTQDNNTTYTTGSSTSAGLTKLYTGTGTNTDGTMTQNAIKTALDGKLSTSGTAAKATGDGSGNEIVKTYIKTASVSGKTVTFTKGDGSTFSITTQDNNTTYGSATSTSAGLVKLYTSTGTSTDGAMDRNSVTNLNKANITNASVSGKDITFTKADASTFKITTQDTNTTYGAATSSSAGLTKLYTSTGTSTDGTMDRNSITNLNKANITSASVSAKVVTFTKADGSTFSITTQDTNDNNKTAQNYSSASANRPLLMGYNASTANATNVVYQAQNKIYANPYLAAIYATSFVGLASSASYCSTASTTKVTGTTSTNSLDGDMMFDFGYEASTVSGDTETKDISASVTGPEYGMFIRNGSGGMTKRTVTNNATFAGASTTDSSTAAYYNGNNMSDIIERYRFFN